MDKVVADYIPKAFAFLYIIDSSSATGVQQDRLGQLLKLCTAKENNFNPESAMFICNKWDQVPPEEEEEVKSETFRKLSEMWPGLEESQLFFVSTRKAVGPGGILSDDFTKVLDGLDLLLPKSLDIKLETQYSDTERDLLLNWIQAPDDTPLVDILFQALLSDELLTDLTERQMQPQRDLMAVLDADITKMMTIMEKTIEKNFKDTRGNAEILQRYDPQSREFNSFLGQLAMFHLTEMRKYEYDLDSITASTDTSNSLGKGSFGEVYQVQVPWKGAEVPAALKIGLPPYDKITNDTAWEFQKEENNLRTLKGDHIVEYYGTACQREKREGQPDKLRLGLVMELCEGTLADRIINKTDHNPAQCLHDPEKYAAAFSYTQNLAVQLCQGLKTIHDEGYVHRDLKPSNILVTKDDTVKIADVGLSKREAIITGTIAGTPHYAAPEVKDRTVYDKSADIFSLGLILWEMWYGTTVDCMEIRRHLEIGLGIRLPTVPPIPEWKELIYDCLEKDPKKRPEIQECLDRISAMKVTSRTYTRRRWREARSTVLSLLFCKLDGPSIQCN
ncbi:hypothetical protein Bbelb_199160 [Branchiostoma belcheri]|nr:hypothetical protein Bbelb_199160 [Branchiostoma belcheri]